MKRAECQASCTLGSLLVRRQGKGYGITTIDQHGPGDHSKPINSCLDSIWKFIKIKRSQASPVPAAMECAFQKPLSMGSCFGCQRAPQRGDVITSSKNITCIRHNFNVQPQVRWKLRAIKVLC